MRRAIPFFLSVTLLAAQTVGNDPAATARVAGKVTNAAGQPLSKANVTVRQVGPFPTPTFSGTSGPDGSFEVTGVAPGNYYMYAERTGYMPQGYNAKPGVQFPVSFRSRFTVAGGDSVTGKDIQMVPATTLSGKVLDEDGDPVAGAQVRVLRRVPYNGQRRLLVQAAATSDPGGEYRVANLAPDKYLLLATAPKVVDQVRRQRKPGEHETDYIDTYYPETTDAEAATAVETFAGRDLGGRHIRLKKASVYHVRGRVEGAPKDAVMRVIAVRPDDLFLYFYGGGALVRTDGSYDLADLSTGAHAIVAVNQTDSFRTLARRLATVDAEDVNDFALQATPPIVVQGHVQVEGDEPAAAAKNPQFRVRANVVEGIQSAGGIAEAPVAEDGTFTLPRVNPGKYGLVVTGGPPDLYWKATKQGDAFLESNVLDVRDGNSTPLEMVYSRNGATVTGVASNGDGSPVKDGYYYLIPDADELLTAGVFKGAVIPAGGNFTIKGVRPGAWHLFAVEDSEPLGGMGLGEVRKILERRGTAIVVKEKETVQVSASIISVADLEKLAAQVQQ